MSDWTGLKATEPSTSERYHQNTACLMRPWNIIPNSVVRLSEASRKSVVGIASFCDFSTGTFANDFLTVSKKVPPGGYAEAMILY